VQTLWVVTFEPGDYRYICDPHPSMNGQFTVS
jgi:plastocyanin